MRRLQNEVILPHTLLNMNRDVALRADTQDPL